MGCTSSQASIAGQERPIQPVNQASNGEPNGKPEDKKQKPQAVKEESKKKSALSVPDPKKMLASAQKGLQGASSKIQGFFHHDPDIDKELGGNSLKGDLIKAFAKNKKKATDLGQDSDGIDSEAGDFIEVADVGEGDEFMAVLPWKGAIKAPDNEKSIVIVTQVPDVSYEIDFVYGYKSEEVRQNLWYNPRKKPVYMTAAIGVIFDPKTRTQKYFGGGETKNMERKQTDFSVSYHTDDITCLTMTNDRTTVATGQVGPSPLVFIWDSITAQLKGQYRLPKGARQVTAIAFNKSGKFIATADFSNDHNIFVHDWQAGTTLWTQKSGPDKVFMIDWSLTADTFCSVGPNNVIFWSNTGQKKKGSFGQGRKATNILCVSHDSQGNAFCGGQDGSIYKFASGGGSVLEAFPTHKGIIHCIRYLEDADNKVVISGGTDLKVIISQWDNMSQTTPIVVDGIPRSIDFSKYLLVGMRNGLIAEYDIEKNAKEIIMHSHHDGEVWGLETLENEGKFITSGDDNKLLMFDIASRKCILKGFVVPDVEGEPAAKQAPKKGGASTTSTYPPDQQSRAVAWNSNLRHLAVADNLGKITIRKVDLPQSKGVFDSTMINKIICTLFEPKEWIECMAYNPQMDKLAAGSHDNNIYVYSVSAAKYTPYHIFKNAHTSFVTSLDWSLNDRPSYIRSNCGGYELLFFNVDSKKQDKSGASSTTGTIWATQSCKLGWAIEGIFPEGCDGTHINGVSQSNELNLIATGDDYGLVNIYRYPVRDTTHQARSLRGHSEHVTRVKFTQNGEYLLSVGGMDQTVIQWKKTVPH